MSGNILTYPTTPNCSKTNSTNYIKLTFVKKSIKQFYLIKKTSHQN